MGSNDLNLAAPFVARYAPIFWEPNPGTGERFVAIVAVSPESGLEGRLGLGAHVVLTAPKLRAMFGHEQANASIGILQQAASLIAEQLVKGASLEKIRAPFAGFAAGEPRRVNAWSVEQLLDTAVRSVSAIGSPDAILGQGDELDTGRSTYRTTEFLRKLRREFAGQDRTRRARFEQRLPNIGGLPDIILDYAFERWLVQVTSLPGTRRQVAASEREAKAKILELDMAQKKFSEDRNSSESLVLVNAAILEDEQASIARAQLPMLNALAKAYRSEVRLVDSPAEAAEVLESLR